MMLFSELGQMFCTRAIFYVLLFLLFAHYFSWLEFGKMFPRLYLDYFHLLELRSPWWCMSSSLFVLV